MDDGRLVLSEVPDDPALEDKIAAKALAYLETKYQLSPSQSSPQATRWIVDKLIRANNAHLLLGKPQRAKSIIADQLAICVSSGRPFLERYQSKQGRVILIDEDTPTDVLEERLRRYANALGRDLESLPLDWRSMTGWRLTEDTARKLAREDAILVILDSLVALTDGNLDKTADAARISRALNILKSSKTVLVTHHISEKSESDITLLTDDHYCLRWAMGNTMLIGFSDAALACFRSKDGFIIKQIPRRNPIDGDKIFGIRVFEDERRTFMWLLYEKYSDGQVWEIEKLREIFMNNPDSYFTVRSIYENSDHLLCEKDIRAGIKKLVEEGFIESGTQPGHIHKFRLKQ